MNQTLEAGIMDLFSVGRGCVGKISGFVFYPEVMGCEFTFFKYKVNQLKHLGIEAGKVVSLRARGSVKCFDGQRSMVEITFCGAWNTTCKGEQEVISMAVVNYQLSLEKQETKLSIKE